MMGFGRKMKICQRRSSHCSCDHFVSQQEERGERAVIGVMDAKKEVGRGGGDKIIMSSGDDSSSSLFLVGEKEAECLHHTRP